MSERLKGTLAGVALSLVAIILWVVLAMLEFIAGIAGALMGILFIIAYKKLNPSDESKYPTVFACILIVVEIIIAEFLTLLVIANMYEVGFSEIWELEGMALAIGLDIGIGLLLSFAVFIGYLFSMKRKNDQLSNKRKQL